MSGMILMIAVLRVRGGPAFMTRMPFALLLSLGSGFLFLCFFARRMFGVLCGAVLRMVCV
jgi:hypothetical protein